MMTLRQLALRPKEIPASTAWYLADLGEALGRQELFTECPGVSVDMIRRVLKDLRAAGRVECVGRGQGAKWRKTEGWESGNEA